MARPRASSYSSGLTTCSLMETLQEHTLSQEELDSAMNSWTDTSPSLRSDQGSNALPKRNKLKQSKAKKQRRKSAADLEYIHEDDVTAKGKESVYGSRTSIASDPSTGQPLLEEDLEQLDLLIEDKNLDNCINDNIVESADVTSLRISLTKLQEHREHEDKKGSDSALTPLAAEQPCIAPLPTQVIPVEAAYQPSTTYITTPVSEDIGVYVLGINLQRPCIDDVLENMCSEYVIGIDMYNRREATEAFSSLSESLSMFV